MKRIIAMLICGMFVFSAYAQKVFIVKKKWFANYTNEI